MTKTMIAASLGIGEIVLIVACALIVAGAIVTAIIRKVRGKPSCGGDCGCCDACKRCKPHSSSETKNR